MNSYLRKRFALIGICLAAALIFAAILYWVPSLLSGVRSSSQTAAVDGSMSDFLERHWRRPIPLQGQAPPDFSALEASLQPEACGTCHRQQYADWKESLHSRAMGSGPWGQIVDLFNSSPDEAIQCMTCHAPLSEQLPVSPKVTTRGERIYEANPHFDKDLQLRGITCAACHVRQHRRYGPPKIEGDSANVYPNGMPNHGGFQATPYFERAEFCKDCHQFDPENTLLVNGKPLQDTYREWKNSIWGQGGAACQDCHMSQRRHLWRGIHDREWVKNGVQINANVEQPKSRVRQRVIAAIEITNSAVGHKFPTYLTPKVFVRAALLDGRNKPLPGTQQERVIGWDARFEDGEWKEFFDTRIDPGKTLAQKFQWRFRPDAAKVRLWVEVHPDHFYHVYFYPAHLKRGDLSAEGRKLTERALEESGKTPYVLFEEILPLINTNSLSSSNPGAR